MGSHLGEGLGFCPITVTRLGQSQVSSAFLVLGGKFKFSVRHHLACGSHALRSPGGPQHLYSLVSEFWAPKTFATEMCTGFGLGGDTCVRLGGRLLWGLGASSVQR